MREQSNFNSGNVSETLELEPLRSLPSQQFNEEVSVFAYTYRGLLKFLTRDELSFKEILSI